MEVFINVCMVENIIFKLYFSHLCCAVSTKHNEAKNFILISLKGLSIAVDSTSIKLELISQRACEVFIQNDNESISIVNFRNKTEIDFDKCIV